MIRIIRPILGWQSWTSLECVIGLLLVFAWRRRMLSLLLSLRMETSVFSLMTARGCIDTQ